MGWSGKATRCGTTGIRSFSQSLGARRERILDRAMLDIVNQPMERDGVFKGGTRARAGVEISSQARVGESNVLRDA